MEENSPNQFHENETFRQFLELVGQINSNLEIDDVLTNIITAAKKITDSEASSVFLLDKETEELIFTTPTGPVRERIEGERFPMDQGIAGWVATHSVSQIVNDVSLDDRFLGDFEPDVFTTRNIMCVPMKNQSEDTIGVLQVINKRGKADYNEIEIPLFQALAHQAAIAITNSNLLEERKTLLSEIHHRVKNNMALVSGMIQLEAFNEEDETVKSKLLKSVTRIITMASVHEQLYESDSFSSLNYSKNLEKVIDETLVVLDASQNLQVSYDCQPMILNINQSIPCSLIVSEYISILINNAFKKSDHPTMEVRCIEEKEQRVHIEILDNGDSIKSLLDQQISDRSGFSLIYILSKQIEAEFKYNEGADMNQFVLNFKKSSGGGAGNQFL